MSTLLALKIPIKGNTKTDIKSQKERFLESCHVLYVCKLA